MAASTGAALGAGSEVPALGCASRGQHGDGAAGSEGSPPAHRLSIRDDSDLTSLLHSGPHLGRQAGCKEGSRQGTARLRSPGCPAHSSWEQPRCHPAVSVPEDKRMSFTSWPSGRALSCTERPPRGHQPLPCAHAGVLLGSVQPQVTFLKQHRISDARSRPSERHSCVSPPSGLCGRAGDPGCILAEPPQGRAARRQGTVRSEGAHLPPARRPACRTGKATRFHGCWWPLGPGDGGESRRQNRAASPLLPAGPGPPDPPPPGPPGPR